MNSTLEVKVWFPAVVMVLMTAVALVVASDLEEKDMTIKSLQEQLEVYGSEEAANRTTECIYELFVVGGPTIWITATPRIHQLVAATDWVLDDGMLFGEQPERRYHIDARYPRPYVEGWLKENGCVTVGKW